MATKDLNEMLELAETVNKANQTMHSVTDQIPQGTKDYVNNAAKKILDSDKLRSFAVFFGMNEGGDFTSWSFPFSPTVACPRIYKNLMFFYLNYLLLAAVILVLSTLALLISPQTLLAVGAILVAWLLLIRSTREGDLTIPGVNLKVSRKNASMILLVISGLVAFFMLKSVFFLTLGSTSTLAVFHAWSRNASKHHTASDQLDFEDSKTTSFVQMGGQSSAV